MTRAALVIIAAATWTLNPSGQDAPDVLKRGEEIYNVNCATAYCHGPKGGFAGAPRLAARGFEAEFLNATIRGGVAGTAMTGFAGKLQVSDLTAVVAYVASLNGIATSSSRGGGPGAGNERPQPPRLLSADAVRGRGLFFDAVRGVDRCSTCHEVDGFGIPVAGAITAIPADVRALRALATPHVKTATLQDDTMPALVVSSGSRGVIFYDLTARPPVLRTAEQSAVRLTDGSTWRHSSALGAYDDVALDAVLAFLRAVGRRKTLAKLHAGGADARACVAAAQAHQSCSHRVHTWRWATEVAAALSFRVQRGTNTSGQRLPKIRRCGEGKQMDWRQCSLGLRRNQTLSPKNTGWGFGLVLCGALASQRDANRVVGRDKNDVRPEA